MIKYCFGCLQVEPEPEKAPETVPETVTEPVEPMVLDNNQIEMTSCEKIEN